MGNIPLSKQELIGVPLSDFRLPRDVLGLGVVGDVVECIGKRLMICFSREKETSIPGTWNNLCEVIGRWISRDM